MSAKQITKKVLEDLARSGLDEKDLKKLGIVPTRAEDAVKLGLTFKAAGYVIPYWTLDGKKTKFYRYRYLEDPRSGFQKKTKSKPRRYEQPPATSPEAYFPPYIKWREIAEGDDNVIITEGEKKAAIATKLGLPTIGLGGVWSFKSKRLGVDLLPSLQEFEWRDRGVYICFDSDAASNPDVRKAERFLADELLRQGAVVYIVRLPPSPDGEKQGLDDYIVAEGLESLKHLLNSTEEFAECRALHEMNDKVVLAREGLHIYSYRDRTRMSANNFVNVLYANESFWRTVETKDGGQRRQKVKTAKAWLEWPGRAEVKRFVYEPGLPLLTEDGSLNLWEGFPYEPVKGDVSPWEGLLDRLFGDEKEARRWFEQWVAYPFQYPGTKLRTAAVIWGRVQGTGKSLLGFTIGDLYGVNYVKIGDKELDDPTFNTWQANRQFAFGDDITGQASRKLANRLKVMVTSETLTINEKYINPYTLRDCINYMFTSNHADAFYMEEGDRRYFIHEVVADRLPPEFYRPYDAWRRSTEGRQALMYHLMNLDLSDFDPMAPAMETTSKIEMIENTRTDIEDLIIGLREEADEYLRKLGGGDLITSKELMAMIDNERINEVTVGKKMKEYGIAALRPKNARSASMRLGGERVRVYALKNRKKWANATHDEIREHWEKHRPHLRRK